MLQLHRTISPNQNSKRGDKIEAELLNTEQFRSKVYIKDWKIKCFS